MNAPASRIEPVLHRLEDRWLMVAAQEVLLGRPVEEVPLAAGVAWPFLLRQASLHALGPGLARYCEGRSKEIPGVVLEQMRREQANVRAYNFFLRLELGRLTGLLIERGVSVLAWKGPALAAVAYGDLSLRLCADLDLMVRPSQMEEAIGVLQGLGYREMEADTGGHTRNLMRESPKAIVELHQLLVQPRFSLALEADELLAGAVTIQTPSGSIPVPAPEKLLLMLCLHGSKHVWERLAWVCDVVLFIRAHPHLDWARLRQDAQACRARRMVRIGLLLAEAVAAGVVPKGELLEAQADVVAGRLARQALELLFVPESSHLLTLRRYWFQLAMREDVRDRWPLLRHFVRLGLTPGPADRAVVKLAPWLGLGYFLIRPLRLAGKVISRRKTRQR